MFSSIYNYGSYFLSKLIRMNVVFLRYAEKLLILQSNSFQASEVTFKKGFEKSTVRFLRRLNLTGKTVFDVGANIGIHSVLFSDLVGTGGRVFAFEPEPENYSLLELNKFVNKLKNIKAVFMAVGDRNGTEKLYLSSRSGEHSLKRKSEKSISVDISTLDTFCKSENIRSVGLIKIDVEGAEFEVLKGASSLIDCFHPTIIFEMSDSYKTITDFLISKSYSLHNISSDGILKEFCFPFSKNIVALYGCKKALFKKIEKDLII